MQLIDVRDLGAWLVRLAEDGTAGVFNAIDAAVHDGASCSKRARGDRHPDARLVWVDERVARSSTGVGEWMELPLWVAGRARWPGCIAADSRARSRRA